MELYKQVARDMAVAIEAGIYSAGEKLPGVRALSVSQQVSPATAVAAYRQLERDGYVEARPRSGYYAIGRPVLVAEPEPAATELCKPRLIASQQRVLQLVSDIHDTAVVRLGAAVADPSYLPGRTLERALAKALREQRGAALNYAPLQGFLGLRTQLSKRLWQLGCPAKPEDILITNGCQEAVCLALRALLAPGDTVAVETPAFHGHLHMIEALGFKVLEIPCHPRTGISLDALRLALEQWPIKACLMVPNYSNPLGSCMSDADKRALVELCRARGAVVIEDDIYGDLCFDERRPSPVARFDGDGSVVYCSSFSKTLAPGLRIGWVYSPRYIEPLKYQKFVNNVAVSSLAQLALAEYLQTAHFDQHLRTFRRQLATCMQRVAEAVATEFPSGTKMTRPSGGYLLWVELPGAIDALQLAELCALERIHIAPGPMFAATERYANCLRLSCAVVWNDKTRHALRRVGQLAAQLRA